MIKASVIITTYNSEVWLEKVLWGFTNQTFKDFEIIVADDGSNSKTKEKIIFFSDKFLHPIQHIWQKDEGFRKCSVLNKAILNSKSEYIIFTDGDCIPRKDFVATHLKNKTENYFLSGGYFKLDDKLSNSISKVEILNGNAFNIKWLLNKGLQYSFKLSKLTHNSFFASFMNWITPTKKTFNGHNTSCFKSDLLKVNGFNEDMSYGGLDREIGERMMNSGIKGKQIRYSAICLHLNHDRKYATSETWLKNNEIRNYNKKNKITFISNGIYKSKV